MNLIVTTAKPKTELLKQVQALFDRNSQTLGLFTPTAIIEHAQKDYILVALDEGNLAGFLVFYINKRNHVAKLKYLCVHEDYRGKGVSRVLFDELVKRTKVYYGISLLCREDYEYASRMWRRLGFTQISEKSGRGKNNTILLYWWYSHNHPTLFDFSNQHKHQAVIDANIFFDLNLDNPKHIDDKSLLLETDWLKDELELLITPELSVEITRKGKTSEHRKRLHLKASSYERVSYLESDFKRICEELTPFFVGQNNDNDISDLRHLAYAIADEDVDFFITRDTNILNMADLIHDKYQLSVVTPVNMILMLDEFQRADEYRRMRFAGTKMSLLRVNAGIQKELSDAFKFNDEKQSAFIDILDKILVETSSSETWVIYSEDKTPLVLFSYSLQVNNELQIPVFRINHKTVNTKIIRYLLLKFLRDSFESSCSFTRITEIRLHNTIKDALNQDRFTYVNDSWVKPNLLLADTAANIAIKAHDILQTKPNLASSYRIHLSLLRDMHNTENIETMAEIESVFWPIKVMDSSLQTMSIPIKPVWAELWFDEKLANRTLFGANKDKVLNRQGVYFSSKSKATNISIPGRIVWYVTSDKNLHNTGLRACSRLDGIVQGTVKDLYRRFRHLGIYEWEELKQLVNGNLNKKITAFQFSDTHLFKNHISYNEWSEITRQVTGKNAPKYSPVLMPPDVFSIVYRRGMALDT